MKRNAGLSMLFGISMLCTFALTGCGNMTEKADTPSKEQSTDKKDPSSKGMIQPTDKANPALKGTRWNASSISSGHLSFTSEDTNIVELSLDLGIVGTRVNPMEALYTVKDSTVSFDLTESVQIWKSMTVAKYITMVEIPFIEEKMFEINLKIEKAQREGDKGEEQEQQEKLAKSKKHLEAVKNPSTEYKKELEKRFTPQKEKAKELELLAKFTGTLSEDKKTLIIEQFPVYDQASKTMTPQKMEFTPFTISENK